MNNTDRELIEKTIEDYKQNRYKARVYEDGKVKCFTSEFENLSMLADLFVDVYERRISVEDLKVWENNTGIVFEELKSTYDGIGKFEEREKDE